MLLPGGRWGLASPHKRTSLVLPSKPRPVACTFTVFYCIEGATTCYEPRARQSSAVAGARLRALGGGRASARRKAEDYPSATTYGLPGGGATRLSAVSSGDCQRGVRSASVSRSAAAAKPSPRARRHRPPRSSGMPYRWDASLRRVPRPCCGALCGCWLLAVAPPPPTPPGQGPAVGRPGTGRRRSVGHRHVTRAPRPHRQTNATAPKASEAWLPAAHGSSSPLPRPRTQRPAFEALHVA
jgi:hypothetical protein